MPKVTIDLTNLPAVTNEIYYPLYANQDRYLILYGGAGSGKSVFAAQKLVYRTLAETGHKFLVVRKVAKTIRHSTFDQLRSVIGDWGMTELFNVKHTEMELNCLNGNQIIHAGLDDAEKMKSIHGITGIWIEEASELSQDDFQQLDLRLRGQTKNYKQIILTFNPVSVTHWLKDTFFDKGKDGATTLKTTYRDNKFIDPEYVKVLESLKDSDEYYYMVYALGEWGVAGKTVYNAQIVTERLMQVRDKKPLARGSFVYDYAGEKIVDKSIRFIEDGAGPLTIYERPQKGYPYVIGGDIAEGGHDYSVGQVRNNITWNQAAIWRDRTDTDLYAKQMYCLGKFYNNALIGIETNFDLHPVKELDRLGYTHQYKREVIDEISKVKQHKHGFQTTKVTRPVIISKHVTLARENINTFNDAQTLEEMLTFVRNEQGKPEAQAGKYDDCIMADAIALEIRGQQTMKAETPPQELTGVYHYAELQMMGYKPSQIRGLRNKVKILGDKR